MNTKAEKHFQEGERFLNNDQFIEAIESFKNVIELERFNSILSGIALQLLCKAYLKSAEIAQEEFDYEVAFYYCDRAIELDPNQFLVYKLRAGINFSLKKYSETIEDLNLVVTRDGKNPSNFLLRAKCYFKVGETIKAKKDIKKAILLGTALASLDSDLKECYLDNCNISDEYNDDDSTESSGLKQKFYLILLSCLFIGGLLFVGSFSESEPIRLASIFVLLLPVSGLSLCLYTIWFENNSKNNSAWLVLYIPAVIFNLWLMAVGIWYECGPNPETYFLNDWFRVLFILNALEFLGLGTFGYISAIWEINIYYRHAKSFRYFLGKIIQILLIGLWMCLYFIVVSFYSSNKDFYFTALRFHARGDYHYNKKDFPRATAEYSKGINKYPQDKLIYFKRGRVYYAQEKYPEANADFTKAIQLSPKYTSYFFERGLAHHNHQEYPFETADKYTKAIELYPQDVSNYCWRGILHYYEEKHPEAIADFTKAIQINPKYTSKLFEQGFEWHFNNNNLKKLEIVAENIKSNPQDSEIYKKVSSYAKDEDLWYEVINSSTKAIQLNSKNYPETNYFNRGLAYKEQGKYFEATADFTKAIELNPKFRNYILNRGEVLRDQQKYPEAIADFSTAIELDPKFNFSFRIRGIAYHDQQKYPEAIADFTKAIELDPLEPQNYYRNGLSKLKLKQGDAGSDDLLNCRDVCDRLIEKDSKNLYAFNLRGLIYKELARNEEALADFSKIIELDPDYIWAFNNRGNLFKEINKYQDSINDYSKLLELNPYREDILVKRGDMFKALGKNIEAQIDFLKAKNLKAIRQSK